MNFIDEFSIIFVFGVQDVLLFVYCIIGCLVCVFINEVWNDRFLFYCNDLIDIFLRFLVLQWGLGNW